MKKPLYKKLKPFLATRYAAAPPEAGRYSQRELLRSWVLRELAANFDMEGAYEDPAEPIDQDVADYFAQLERGFEMLIAAADAYRTEFESRENPPSARRPLPLDRLKEFEQGGIPLPPPKPPAPGGPPLVRGVIPIVY